MRQAIIQSNDVFFTDAYMRRSIPQYLYIVIVYIDISRAEYNCGT